MRALLRPGGVNVVELNSQGRSGGIGRSLPLGHLLWAGTNTVMLRAQIIHMIESPHGTMRWVAAMKVAAWGGRGVRDLWALVRRCGRDLSLCGLLAGEPMAAFDHRVARQGSLGILAVVVHPLLSQIDLKLLQRRLLDGPAKASLKNPAAEGAMQGSQLPRTPSQRRDGSGDEAGTIGTGKLWRT